MKHVTLAVEDAAYEKLLGMLDLCPQVTLVSADAVDDDDSAGRWLAGSLMVMQQQGDLRYPKDHTYIMQAANEEVIKGLPFFYSPYEYLAFLKSAGLEDLPSKSTLYNTAKTIVGRYPDWTFLDHPTDSEALRRKNIVRLFMSAFFRVRRTGLDGLLENRG